MGLSESDIRRMAPWAQEQVAVQMVRRGGTSRTPSPTFRSGGWQETSPCPTGDGKYHAKKAVRLMPNGEKHVFDSQKEARRYDELAMLAAVGVIRDLRLQVQFTLQESYISAEGNRVRAIRYVADFQYFDCVAGEIVVEDVKSKATKTRVYEVKKKLMAERYGIAIREV